MAQAEDTELRDLVIEALEKNGSLAKIHALLRANIFLAFEDECESIRKNISLDNILEMPEGMLSLSIIHEFLEFCNLKNTLFVYMAESRQGKEYNYEGKKILNEKLNLASHSNIKEPILVTLMKRIFKSFKNDCDSIENLSCKNDHKDEQNSSYIVHEDSQSSTTSNSQSDNSSDRKNKLHLRLQLDNSDTDTSSDSTRDKSSSEYIPSEHIIHSETKNNENSRTLKQDSSTFFINDLEKVNLGSTDSTSYVEINPYNSLDQKLLNTSGLPAHGNEKDSPVPTHSHNEPNLNDSSKSATLSNVSSLSIKNESGKKVSDAKSPQGSAKSDAEYTYDFSLSQNKNISDHINSPESIKEDVGSSINKNTSMESQHQNSQSSQSSVSISDVADLLSEKSFSLSLQNNNRSFDDRSYQSVGRHSKRMSHSNQSRISSDESGGSPIPSISNLSLEIHSD